MIFYLIVIIVLFLIFVRYLENTSIFYPQRMLAATPQSLGLPFEEVIISTQDHVKIHGWLIKAPSAKSTLIFFPWKRRKYRGPFGEDRSIPPHWIECVDH